MIVTLQTDETIIFIIRMYVNVHFIVHNIWQTLEWFYDDMHQRRNINHAHI